MLSDIEIAQGCQMRPITEVAAAAGLDAAYEMERTGFFVCDERSDRQDGRRPSDEQRKVLGIVCSYRSTDDGCADDHFDAVVRGRKR